VVVKREALRRFLWSESSHKLLSSSTALEISSFSSEYLLVWPGAFLASAAAEILFRRRWCWWREGRRVLQRHGKDLQLRTGQGKAREKAVKLHCSIVLSVVSAFSAAHKGAMNHISCQCVCAQHIGVRACVTLRGSPLVPQYLEPDFVPSG